MATKKVGALVKEARTKAGLTQENLAKKVGGLTGNDIGKCERGEADLSAAQLKKIAVACGVTQSSLINAPKNLSASAAKKAAAKTATVKKPAAAKKTTTTAEKKTTAKTTAAKKPAATEKKTTAAKTAAAKKPAVPASANVNMKVTASEKKLVEAYRSAPTELKKAALKVLKGEYGDTVTKLLSATSGSGSSGGISNVLNDVIGNLFNK